jgi:uncharacterized OB-fold protein
MRDRSAYHREYYRQNKERISQKCKEYYRMNKDKVLGVHAAYRVRGKQCPRCGESISVWQTTCRKCRPLKPKTCRRCGEVFHPDSNYRQVCDGCLMGEREQSRMRELASSAEPCTKCQFLERCKQEIRSLDGWPLCWASSPARDEFIQTYLGERTLQGQLARTLRDAIQGGNDDAICVDADIFAEQCVSSG